MVKVVLFDLDDTLISERDYIQSGYYYVSNLISHKHHQTAREINLLLNELFIESPKHVFNRLFDHFGIEYTRSTIMELVEAYRNHKPMVTFFDDVLPCLEILKDQHIQTGVITDGYAEGQCQKLRAVNGFDHFNEIIITDQLGRDYWKPHARAYEMMKDLFNVKYSEMVYVGDNVSKDFVTPNKLGMKTVQINRENGIYSTSTISYEKEFYAQHSINSLYEFLNLFCFIEYHPVGDG
ncbi:HAD family hydrolase [Anaerobacillus sp. 1_MG-2023]|uniref:HAD family hydrolase n=1 Tax=Bacillales TaxID=1385 RepID=UPI0026E13E8B|nr:HAD hydrolase-like protein [Anaerobacillus sp. 1_MG-2023]MDO6657822.1 HAD hydrolase-like protein [Anaerobacillus sp. 1_MG-2023]